MKINRNDDICPICGKVMYIGKIDKACTDPECEMGQGELAYLKRLDDKYFEIIKQRISEARNKPKQITLWRR
jgi:hypothetical protein